MADQVIATSLIAEDNVSPKVKNIKAELKAAQQEVIVLAEKFGATSKQAAEAAKKAAELKDKIGDAKSLVDAFNPDTKFRAFGASIQTVVGGFTALTGAMGLLGVESEQVQKTLLKVQSALAISQGVAQLQEGMQAFKNLGSVIVNTLGKSGMIGIAIAGVAALGAAFLGVFDGAKKLTDQQKTLNEVSSEAGKIYAKERAELEKLVQPLKNETTSKEDKLAAIKKLQDTYPNYFKNLQLEGDKVVGLTAGYNQLVKAIGLKARATAAGNLLAKQEEDLLAKGFEMGITSEEQALAIVARLEKSGNEFDKLLLSQARGIIEKRNFLQSIVADAEKQLAALGGDPRGGGNGATNTGPKEDQYISKRNGIVQLNEAIDINKIKQIEAAQLQKTLTGELVASDNAATLNFLKNKADQNSATQQQLAIEEYAAGNRKKLIAAIGNALGALSDLVGKQTAAGKVMAIAEATINTYLAASSILKNTARNPVTGAIPGFAIAQMIATIAAGLVTVRNIVKTPVPGAGGGGQGGGSVSPPLTPQLATATNTRLDQAQLNQIGNAAVRAFVVESDVTNNQERVRRLNRAARL